jgi:hypothetical protein
MTRTRMSLAHAQAIITELMKSIIREIDIPLRIVEVEGDALLVYGVEGKDEYNWEEVISFVSEKILLFFQLFHKRLHELIHSNMTEMTYAELSKYKHFEIEKRVEKYEDIGKVNVYVHYPNTVPFVPESHEKQYSEVSIYRKLKQTLQIGMNGMLMTLGLKSVPRFHHLSKS